MAVLGSVPGLSPGMGRPPLLGQGVRRGKAHAQKHHRQGGKVPRPQPLPQQK